MNARAKLVGDLADAATKKTAATENIDDARQQGSTLVRDAEARAAALLQEAQQRAHELEAAYGEQYATATAAGWSTADLKLLGYEAPPGRRARLTPKADAQTSPAATLPHQVTPAEAEQNGEQPAAVGEQFS